MNLRSTIKTLAIPALLLVIAAVMLRASGGPPAADPIPGAVPPVVEDGPDGLTVCSPRARRGRSLLAQGEGELKRRIGYPGLPYTAVLDRSHRIAKVVLGFGDDLTDLERTIQAVVAEEAQQ